MRENFMQSKKTSLIALQAARFEGSLWTTNRLGSIYLKNLPMLIKPTYNVL